MDHRAQHPRRLDRGPSSKVGRILLPVVGRHHHMRDQFLTRRLRVEQEVFTLVLGMQAYGVVGDGYRMSLPGPSL